MSTSDPPNSPPLLSVATADEAPLSSAASSAAPPSARKSSSDMKKANKPMLVHQRWKAKQAKEAELAATIKEGKSLSKRSSGKAGGCGALLVKLLKLIAYALLASVFLSRAVTNTWAWGWTAPKYNSIQKIHRALFPPKLLTLSMAELAKHDGSSPSTHPVYVALDGDVYDVSAGKGSKTYGPGGGYHLFAGRDAARAFVTGCFKTHLTYDLRGLGEKELRSLEGWKKFYANHADYFKVGTVSRPPIDPNSPLPEDCNPKAEGGAV